MLEYPPTFDVPNTPYHPISVSCLLSFPASCFCLSPWGHDSPSPFLGASLTRLAELSNILNLCVHVYNASKRTYKMLIHMTECIISLLKMSWPCGCWNINVLPYHSSLICITDLCNEIHPGCHSLQKLSRKWNDIYNILFHCFRLLENSPGQCVNSLYIHIFG